MCNLYSLTKGQSAIRDWFRARHDRTGNPPLFPGIFPDQLAPIVRTGSDGERELVMARWGMPGPPQYGGAPVTNIRNLTSMHWQGWLGRRNRCLVPATSFCEYADTKPRKTPTWFALSEDRPLFAFAGLWTPWNGVRGPKGAPVEGRHELFGFLTTEANAIVAPIHPRQCRSFSRRPKRWTFGCQPRRTMPWRFNGHWLTMRFELWPRVRRRTEARGCSSDPASLRPRA
jgi:putative SOS response-associated peptidase YedK